MLITTLIVRPHEEKHETASVVVIEQTLSCQSCDQFHYRNQLICKIGILGGNRQHCKVGDKKKQTHTNISPSYSSLHIQ